MGGAELLLMNICMAFPNETSNLAGNCTKTQPKDESNDLPVAYNILPQKEQSIPPVLRITTLEDMPMSGTVMRDGKLVGTGHAFYILGLLQDQLNFTYEIIKPKKNVLGDQHSGIFGQLNDGDVHMAVAFLPINRGNHKMWKYSTALDEAEWTILMKRPEASATGSGLFAPFDTNVWILIVISLIVVGPIIYILIFIRSKLLKDGETKQYSLPVCMWFVYGALLKQGSSLSPVADSARLLFATWWIFITILTSFYTANLTAFLTLSQFTLPINTAGDLVSKHQHWFTPRGRTIEMFSTNDDELANLKTSVDNGYGHYVDLDDSSDIKVLNEIENNRMFLRERPIVESLVFKDYMEKTHRKVEESKRCTYVIMPGSIFVIPRAFGFPINTTIDITIDRKLRSMVETGIIKYTTSKGTPGIPICPLNLGSTERQLRNADLSMTYKVVGVGFTVAVIAFVGEVVNRCYHKRQLGSWMKNGDRRKPELPIYSVEPPNTLKRSPPPLYQNIHSRSFTKKHFINGRDYYVVTEKDGDKRLVPVRTPSAFLFQYAA